MHLRSISPDATPDEVAAIVAAIEECAPAVVIDEGARAAGEPLQEWVRGARLTARRSGLQRGPWRLSGRIGRRSRA
jgi:hypothetical protein